MNIDEVESVKGLRFMDEEIPTEIIAEYIEKAVKYAKDHSIKPTNGCYHIFVPPNNKHIKYGLSRWHYNQRRVRARRERIQKRIESIKRAYSGCNPIVTKLKRGQVNRGSHIVTAIQDSQIHIVYVNE